MKKSFHLTFDIDWAPDCSIEKCLNLLDESDYKATFFATHHTDMNKEILLRGHELGIHPNFFPGSSHGSNVQKIIETCLNFSPNAKYIRTHGLYQSSMLLYEIFKNFPQLTTDISIFMHKAKYVQRAEFKYDDVSFHRILYNWEDDSEFPNMCYKKKDNHFFGPLTVFDFHPIHVHLNSSNGKEYAELKSSIRNEELHKTNLSVIDKFINKNLGTGTFLNDILSSENKSIKLEEIK